MKRVFPLIFCLWPHLMPAETESRISQVLPVPATPWHARSLDADGDGDLDVFFAGDPGEFPTWIENLGERNFANPRVIYFPDQYALRSPADLNGDGGLDFLAHVDSFESSSSLNVKIVAEILDEKLGLAERFVLKTGGSPWNAVDLDGDGKAEILETTDQTFNPETEERSCTLKIWNLHADGTLTAWMAPLAVEGFGSLQNARAVDADEDGDLDLFGDSFLLQRSGARSFVAAARRLPEFLPDEHPDDEEPTEKGGLADLNGDGLPDLYRANFDFVWYPNLGNLDFGERVEVIMRGALLKVEPVASSQAILTFSKLEQSGGVNFFHIVRKRLDSETPLTDVVVGSNTPDLVADFDGDGFADVFSRVYYSSDGTRPAMQWGSETGFSPVAFISDDPMRDNARVETGDFNGDLKPDLILGPDISDQYLLMKGDGEGGFTRERYLTELLPAELANLGVEVLSIKSGDVNADGDLDLMVIRRPSSAPLVYMTAFELGNGDGTFRPPVLPPGAFDFMHNLEPCDELVDWDGDGDLDAMAFGGWRENQNGVLSAISTPLMTSAIDTDTLGNSSRWNGFTAGDLDGDGRSDLIAHVFEVVQSEEFFGYIESSSMGVGYSDALGGIEEIALIPAMLAASDALGNPSSAGSCAILDLNTDGSPDLLYTEVDDFDYFGNQQTATRWKRNPGNGSRNPANWVTTTLPFSSSGIFPGDFDGDGRPDWSDGKTCLTPAPGGPQVSPLYDFYNSRLFENSQVLHVADFDGDGDGDILLQSRGQLNLVRNLIIDERSGVAARMRTLGVLGKRANPDEDADGDGRCNAAEFLDGTDPEMADKPGRDRSLPELSFAGGGVAVSFENRDDAAELDLSYILESSSDLVTWMPVEDDQATMQDLPDPWRVSEISLGEMEERAFFRVRKTHAVPVR